MINLTCDTCKTELVGRFMTHPKLRQIILEDKCPRCGSIHKMNLTPKTPVFLELQTKFIERRGYRLNRDFIFDLEKKYPRKDAPVEVTIKTLVESGVAQ